MTNIIGLCSQKHLLLSAYLTTKVEYVCEVNGTEYINWTLYVIIIRALYSYIYMSLKETICLIENCHLYIVLSHWQEIDSLRWMLRMVWRHISIIYLIVLTTYNISFSCFVKNVNTCQYCFNQMVTLLFFYPLHVLILCRWGGNLPIQFI